MRRERLPGRFDPMDQSWGFEATIKSNYFIFMKLVLFFSRIFLNYFVLKTLRDEVILRPICDMQGYCLVVNGISGSAWVLYHFASKVII